jgi:hypothetical protein
VADAPVILQNLEIVDNELEPTLASKNLMIHSTDVPSSSSSGVLPQNFQPTSSRSFLAVVWAGRRKDTASSSERSSFRRLKPTCGKP